MKTTIAGFSNERLESEISAIYWRAAKEAPGIRLRETGNLALLWEEFEERLAEGTIPDDTEWTEKEEWETE